MHIFFNIIGVNIWLRIILLNKNYNDPLGADINPETKSSLDDIISGDEIASIPTSFEEPSSEISKLRGKSFWAKRGIKDKKARKGFLDVNMIYSGKLSRHPNFRFLQKSLSGQDDDFFNKENGSSDPSLPSKEVEMLRKESLSNGVLVVDRKRTCNVETGKYPEYYLDLRRD